MSNKHRQESLPSSERPRGLVTGVALAAGGAAVAAVVGGNALVSHFVEPDKAETAVSPTSEQINLETITDLPQDMKNTLIFVQKSREGVNPAESPADIPKTLNQFGEKTFTIVAGKGGLEKQATDAYKEEFGLLPDQNPSMDVQKSILFTVKALELEGDHVINNGDPYVILNEKDADGNELAIVAHDNGSVNN
jgi:hypothetical protein